METNSERLRPTPEEARAALDGTESVRASVSALSATPWPLWFTAVLTAMLAALPIGLGGALAEPEWLMPRWAWFVAIVVVEGVFFALFFLASRRWTASTGVALRLNVLPKAVTLSAMIGLPVIVVGAGIAFRMTGEVWWLLGAATIGAALSIAFHLWFVRLHERQS
ncbi:hypothetical protein [Microbacterium sp. MPKO10]|uniref:hypothetical protein n=1 Tax=Microbacterium sp. MPKO10 TaxID=2989818 RepID=UPI00223589F9|nr:hypothetical protein [Microbacterium sp. MPKO10]MCW4457353.1 hypothetical protein [Microbacterium sp. MPKO10]